jgi:hypothetical protein
MHEDAAMKSTERKFEFLTREDPDTGARVTRLTPPDVTCHRNYFYQKCFTNDGAKLMFGGEFGPQPELEPAPAGPAFADGHPADRRRRREHFRRLHEPG